MMTDCVGLTMRELVYFFFLYFSFTKTTPLFQSFELNINKLIKSKINQSSLISTQKKVTIMSPVAKKLCYGHTQPDSIHQIYKHPVTGSGSGSDSDSGLSTTMFVKMPHDVHVYFCED